MQGHISKSKTHLLKYMSQMVGGNDPAFLVGALVAACTCAVRTCEPCAESPASSTTTARGKSTGELPLLKNAFATVYRCVWVVGLQQHVVSFHFLVYGGKDSRYCAQGMGLHTREEVLFLLNPLP